MRCPECNLENEARAEQCVKCGADLTQAAIMQREIHGTNQVWNTDIDMEKNSKNTRTALLVLGGVVVLVIALIVALLLYLPTVISYSMDSFTLPDINISDIVDELFWEDIEVSRTEPVPEPETPPANRLDGADQDFIDSLTAYAIELCYVDDAEQARELHQMFCADFEYQAVQEYRYSSLCMLAQDTHRIALLLSDPATDSVETLKLLNELSAVIWTAQESFYFLSDYPDILDYYANLQWYTEAMLEAEYSLQFQLTGASTEYSREHGCQVVYYTNDTPYTMDVQITNDFVTDTEHYSSEYIISGLMPGQTEAIPLPDLEEIGDQDHTWTLNWEVLQLYMDDIPIEDYFQ